jgi:hypothetical protein
MSTPTPSLAGFPRALLEQPIAARLRYFETKVVAHQQLKQVHADLLHAIRHPAGASLIFVFGPTGVGKTTLRQRIERQLIEDASADPSASPGHIPVVGMEAASPDSGNFSWKDYYTRALMALDEPLLSDKIGYEVRGVHRDDQGRLVIERTLTVPDLRRVLEKCLLHRQPRAFLVDEAQHFKKMTSGRRLLDQMDNLKSLANMTNTVHVLIGTYDLLGLMNLSAQLSRRSIEIHFPRYHAEWAADLAEFKKLLRTLQRHLPLPEEPDLEGQYEYFYERSLGCTGMLKTWLNRTLAAALEHNASTLTQQLCEQHAEPLQKLKHMIREIHEGEQALQENEADARELRAFLKLGSDLTPPLDTPLKAEQAAPASSSPTQPRKGRGSSVGKRAPTRDPVGGEDQRAS